MPPHPHCAISYEPPAWHQVSLKSQQTGRAVEMGVCVDVCLVLGASLKTPALYPKFQGPAWKSEFYSRSVSKRGQEGRRWARDFVSPSSLWPVHPKPLSPLHWPLFLPSSWPSVSISSSPHVLLHPYLLLPVPPSWQPCLDGSLFSGAPDAAPQKGKWLRGGREAGVSGHQAGVRRLPCSSACPVDPLARAQQCLSSATLNTHPACCVPPLRALSSRGALAQGACEGQGLGGQALGWPQITCCLLGSYRAGHEDFYGQQPCHGCPCLHAGSVETVLGGQVLEGHC